ncbi:TolC family protein [Candidatus Aerophobetes bacterium]|uniref:TolC family protein n=1 Tax=Aerophobetes bacterium TaxID=2030807 RepID=A0A523UNR8_UNCAE|nr:MAG: TolC family protein [Candidatus Aerophobetes bacterium]
MKMRVVFLALGSLLVLSSPAGSSEELVKLTLSESIKQALEGNLDIRIAEIQLQKVESEIAQREASFKPKLSFEFAPAAWVGKPDSLDYAPQARLSASLLTERGTTYSLNLKQEKGENEGINTTLSFILTQKILPHPRVDSSYLALEKSFLDLEQKKLSLEEEKNRLKLKVTVNFYDILKGQRKIELNRLYLKETREDLLIIKDKVDNQLASELDLLNTQMQVANAEDAVFQSQDELSRSSREFKDLLGIDPEVKIKWVAESQYEPEPLDLNLEEAVKEALANRGEIKRKKLSIKQTELDLALVKSRISPSLNLSGGYSYTELEKVEYQVSLIFQIPLTDGGEGRAEVKTAGSRLEEAYLNLEKLERDIGAEVKNYFFDLQRRARKIELSRLSQNWYEKDLQIARRRFSGGSITENEVREKEIDFKQAEISLLEALLDYETSRSTFLKSLGRKL